MSENDSPLTAACYFCNQEVDVDEYLCHGCGEVICDDCSDPTCALRDEHHPQDYQAENDA